MRFLSSWLADCIQVTCMLAGALLCMQIPALTHAYMTGLIQVAQDARRDIDRRESDARQFYKLPLDTDDQAVIAALRPVEPSNAATLVQSVARTVMFSNTYALLTNTPPFRQPIIAVWDALARPEPDKLAVLQTSFATFIPQIALDVSSLTYGLLGLLLGGFLGHLFTAAPRMLARPRLLARRRINRTPSKQI